MRNYEKERQQDIQVMAYLSGKDAMTCQQIEAGTGISEFDLRKSLMRLCDKKELHKWFSTNSKPPGWVYEKAHGGYSPEPKGAA
ncbi:MAG: hypothetical protein R3193_08810 [Marinobacter sp.]|nr:hypothetical protein [Marinobacter sp.]